MTRFWKLAIILAPLSGGVLGSVTFDLMNPIPPAYGCDELERRWRALPRSHGGGEWMWNQWMKHCVK